MTQYNFTTNIEHRMPHTGEVYCIDRMTSDYAQAHPLDVDGFIENVYQEFVGTEFEEPREVLRSVWNAVLSNMNPCGNASLYPNKNGAKRPAAMKVWHKAGDYWRRGLRIGDTLPDMVPMTGVTRMDGGWIALFPKDSYLIENGKFSPCERPEVERKIENEEVNYEQSGCAEPEVIETTTDSCVPMVASDQRSSGTNCTDNEPLTNNRETITNNRGTITNNRGTITNNREHSDIRHQTSDIRHQTSSIRHQTSSISHQASSTLKALGMVAAATVALFVIYETGLLIPLGLIGLATGGILK